MKCQSLKRWTIYQKCDKVDGSGNTGVLFLYDKNRLQLSRGCPFFVVRRLLVSVVCLVAEKDLCGAQAQQLWLMHLVAPQHVESSLIRNQTGPLHWQVNS